MLHREGRGELRDMWRMSREEKQALYEEFQAWKIERNRLRAERSADP